MKNLFKKFICCILILLIMLSIYGFTPSCDLIEKEIAQIIANEAFSNLSQKYWTFSNCINLTDLNGNLTYYCFDYFYNKKPVGYIVISANVEYELITEYSDSSISPYINNSQESTIYYNPFSKYSKIENSFYDEKGNLIQKDNIEKKFIKAKDKDSNKEILKEIKKRKKEYQAGGQNIPSNAIDGGYDCIFKQPDYLSYEYGGSWSAYGYHSLESNIVNNEMLSICNKMNDVTVDGRKLVNENHCGLTALANAMLYHRTSSCGNFPSNNSVNDSGYISMMNRLANVAYENGYFNPFDQSYIYVTDLSALVSKSFSSYGYNNASSSVKYTPSWSVITNELESGNRPFVMWLDGDRYQEHFVTAYAYNRYRSYYGGVQRVINFLKVAPGDFNQGVYVNFNSLQSYGDYTMITVLPY